MRSNLLFHFFVCVQVPVATSLRLLRCSVFSCPEKYFFKDGRSLCWLFLKLVEKLPPPFSLQIAQGLRRKIMEWMRLNSNSCSSSSVMNAFAATVLEISIRMSNQQQFQQEKRELRVADDLMLDTKLWLNRISSGNTNFLLSTVPVGLPRLLLLLLTKGQFALAIQVMHCLLGSTQDSNSDAASIPIIPTLPSPLPLLISRMLALESLNSSSSSPPTAAMPNADCTQAMLDIAAVRTLVSQTPSGSPRTPTWNAFVSSVKSRCLFIESSISQTEQQHPLPPVPPPWWSYLFVRPLQHPAPRCDVDFSVNAECLTFR
jgi:hypothetical protein